MNSEYKSIKDELPEKGKDIIGLDEDGNTYHCYRCACPNPNCKEWRCSILGYGLIIDVVKWKYDIKNKINKMQKIIQIQGEVQLLKRQWWQLYKRGWYKHINLWGEKLWIRFTWNTSDDQICVDYWAEKTQDVMNSFPSPQEAKKYENAKRMIYQFELEQESFLKLKKTLRLKIGDEIDLDMGEGKIEKVTVSKITPHPEVKGSVYYEFSNGVVCRDIRLH